MIPLITKQQISKYVTLSENIASLNVDSFIKDACEFDTINVFPVALLEAIETQIKNNIQQWNKNKTYATDDKVLYDTYYNATGSSTGSVPPSANWEDFELMNFYLQYLQPYIAYCFYYRFIAYHGANITPAGIQEITPENSQVISDKRRGEMLGDIKNKMNVWSAKVSKKLSDVDWTFDEIQYLPENGKGKKKSRVRIYALGASDFKKCYPFNHDIE